MGTEAFLPPSPLLVLVHRVMITNVREVAEHRNLAQADSRMKDKPSDILTEPAEWNAGLLQTIGIQLQYPLGWDTTDTESLYVTASVGTDDCQGTLYTALEALAAKIFGQPAIAAVPAPWQFDWEE